VTPDLVSKSSTPLWSADMERLPGQLRDDLTKRNAFLPRKFFRRRKQIVVQFQCRPHRNILSHQASLKLMFDAIDVDHCPRVSSHDAHLSFPGALQQRSTAPRLRLY